MSNVGVITEQAYPAGQFGFQPLNESDQKKVNEQQDKKPEARTTK